MAKNNRVHAMTIQPGEGDVIRNAFEDLEAGRCPHCHRKCTQTQVANCVYGSCGHRLYQGKADPRYAAKE